ncbi:hypothetical protein HELRODRAFT_86321 [Helobdella robusta]|uniref:Uncharacterized protein n=1 Tax=Helobdella robusta TaxID=6412 RepID=T1G6A3_HELRO|nr:hypothetical protein HELRODRAFT_86321 [Helobdella robusta]ESN95832.1 hypothetical protein HELRODRAFT_86321 [Helobdella robusta]
MDGCSTYANRGLWSHSSDCVISSSRRTRHGAARPVHQRWVFGGIDQDTNDAFLAEVERRDAATLYPKFNVIFCLVN